MKIHSFLRPSFDLSTCHVSSVVRCLAVIARFSIVGNVRAIKCQLYPIIIKFLWSYVCRCSMVVVIICSAIMLYKIA